MCPRDTPRTGLLDLQCPDSLSMMRRLRGVIEIMSAAFRPILLAGCLLVMPVAVQAQALGRPPETDARAGDEARRVAAMQLAQTLQPRDVVVTEALSTLDRGFVDTLMSQKEVRDLEAQYPGIVQAMWTGARPIAAEMLEQALPKLWNRLADVYASKLSTDQIEATKAFFASPTGRKVILLLNRNADLRPLMRDVFADEKGQITPQGYVESVVASAGRTAGQMSPAEIGEMDRFMRSPAGLAMAAMAVEVRDIGVAWMNESEPKYDARIERAMTEAAAARIGGKQVRPTD
jgi:hypothetical protein